MGVLENTMGSAPVKQAPPKPSVDVSVTAVMSPTSPDPRSPADPHSVEWLLWKLSQTEGQERARQRRKRETKKKPRTTHSKPLQDRRVNNAAQPVADPAASCRPSQLQIENHRPALICTR